MLRKLSKEELYEKIGTCLDEIEKIEMKLEKTNLDSLKYTYIEDLRKYNLLLNNLIQEKERRIEVGEIVILSPEEYEEKFFDKEFFKDINVIFKPSHFQRIVADKIDQDYDINIEIKVVTSDDRYTACITLPLGFKKGYLLKREGNSIYYTGRESDFEIYFNNDSVTKIIIHQHNTGAIFIYS